MRLQELNAHAIAGRIDELNLISIEGGVYYLLEARMHGAAFTLDDRHGAALHLRSVEHAREVLHATPELPFHLIHTAVHDEMCGMPGNSADKMKVPMPLHSRG